MKLNEKILERFSGIRRYYSDSVTALWARSKVDVFSVFFSGNDQLCVLHDFILEA